MTAEEFYDWANGPGNEDRSFELERGQVVEMPLGSRVHGMVCGNVVGVIGNHVFAIRRGYLCSNNIGVIVERNPDTVLAPDVCFFDDGRTFDDLEPGFSVTPPRLVVEVLESHDTLTRTACRIQRFLAFGVAAVWTLDPEARVAAIYQVGSAPWVLEATEELTGGDILPQFRCRVADFFALPWERS